MSDLGKTFVRGTWPKHDTATWIVDHNWSKRSVWAKESNFMYLRKIGNNQVASRALYEGMTSFGLSIVHAYTMKLFHNKDTIEKTTTNRWCDWGKLMDEKRQSFWLSRSFIGTSNCLYVRNPESKDRSCDIHVREFQSEAYRRKWLETPRISSVSIKSQNRRHLLSRTRTNSLFEISSSCGNGARNGKWGAG